MYRRRYNSAHGSYMGIRDIRRAPSHIVSNHRHSSFQAPTLAEELGEELGKGEGPTDNR